MDFIKKDNALMAFGRDIEKGDIFDCLRIHDSLVKPLHRYDGELALLEGELIFKGEDIEDGTEFGLKIRKDDLLDLYLGFDKILGKEENRSTGLGLQPLRIKYRGGEENETRILYILTNFSRLSRGTKNEEWYRTLSNWTKEEHCTQEIDK